MEKWTNQTAEFRIDQRGASLLLVVPKRGCCSSLARISLPREQGDNTGNVFELVIVGYETSMCGVDQVVCYS